MANETPADKAKREAMEAELKKKADAEAERIMKSDEGSNKDLPDPDEEFPATDDGLFEQPVGKAPSWGENFKSLEQETSALEAAEKLHNIALSYPNTTPDTHTIFGFGGTVFKLGDLRALYGLRRGS